jgi:hypothetical protein
MVRIQRSAWAFAFGVRTGVTSTSALSARNTSNPRQNFASRSRMRNRTGRPGSFSIRSRLRAYWVTQLPVGLAVTPARWTRRVASSMKNSTSSRRSQIVSTVRKSQATMPSGCWRRNARHVVAVGRGTRPRRSARDRPGQRRPPEPDRPRRAGRSRAGYRRECHDLSGSARSTSKTPLAGTRHSGTPRNSRSGEHHHPRPGRAGHPRRQRDLAHPPAVQLGIDHHMGAALHQRHHWYLGKRPATLAPVAAGTPELLVVGWRVGHLPARPVHRQQPQAPPERPLAWTAWPAAGPWQRTAPATARHQPLPGAKQRRLRRHPPRPHRPKSRSLRVRCPSTSSYGAGENSAKAGTNDTTSRAGNSRRRCSARPHAATTRSTRSGGSTQVNTPSPDSSGTPRPPAHPRRRASSLRLTNATALPIDCGF